MQDDASENAEGVSAGDDLSDPLDRSRQPLSVDASDGGSVGPKTVPEMAPMKTLWSPGVRSIAIVVITAVIVAYALFGTILARNVTFNISQAIEPGRTTGIRRFYRETIVDVWRTMWAKAPDFGTIDLTRAILLTSTVVFFTAFALIISLVFVPSRRDWASSLGSDQESDTLSSD